MIEFALPEFNVPPTPTLPTDPLFRYQWGLYNTGQAHGGVGIDIDVVPVWTDYTGAGVRVAVVDDGTQLNHPDLIGNIDPSATWDATTGQRGGNPTTSKQNHGTATAGIIAAKANNGVGGSGVAPNATLGIYRINLGEDSIPSNTSQYAVAFGEALRDRMDVVSNSWGSRQEFGDLHEGIDVLAIAGREGRGSVVVFANGNDRAKGFDGALDMTTNSPYVIAVAAIDNNGVATTYSTPGANLLISAPGGASTGQLSTIPGTGIVTTDRTGADGYNTMAGTAGDYDYAFNGTSAATPFISGVAALVLQADPNLNYREVQQVLAKSARMNDESGSAWRETASGDWNGGGSEFNRNYGFGLVDARAAVRLAESYVERNVIDTSQEATKRYIPPSPIDLPFSPDEPKAAWFKFDINDTVRVEHVSLSLALNVENSEDVNVVLKSPSGTSIVLLSSARGARGVEWPSDGFTLSSPAFWGEGSAGTWTVGIWSTAQTLPARPEQLVGANLTVSGGAVTANQEITYTDDFPMVASLDPTRLIVPNPAGSTIINAAAVSGSVNFNLPTHTLSIDGVTSSINPQAMIDAVYGGDGNDTFVGGNSDMMFSPGRGNNSVTGGGGNDTVHLLNALSGYTNIRYGSSVILTGAESQDTMSGIKTLQFRDGSLALSNNPLIDSVFYDKANPDVFASGMSTEIHYASFGWREGRNPDAFFSSKAYLANHKDVAASGTNPLTYFDTTGWRNGDDPSAAFDSNLYLKLNPDVLLAGVDPLAHFLEFGQAEGRRVLPVIDSTHIKDGFDPTYYNLANPDVAASGSDPSEHWKMYGAAEHRNPDAFFDTNYYLSHNTDVAAAGVNPLQHYLNNGWKEGRDPSSLFSSKDYLVSNSDVKAAGMDPLLHFLQYGAGEGRLTIPVS